MQLTADEQAERDELKRACSEAVHSKMFLQSRMASQWTLSRNDRRILKEARADVDTAYQALRAFDERTGYDEYAV